MSQIDDEEMFLMMNPIIVLKQQMKFEFEELGSYPDKQDCYYGMDLVTREFIDDTWNELITEEFPNVGW